MQKTYKTSHKLAAYMTLGVMGAGYSRDAAAAAGGGGAATDFVTLTSNIITSSGGIQNLIALVGYLGGSGLAVAGILKLKQHVDNPGQTPLKDGLVRLGAGGGLLSLPFMTSAMQGSISDGEADQADIGTLKAFTVGAP